MRKFEYLTRQFFLEETIQDYGLYELGKQGWELVAVETFKDGNRLYFKREI